MNSDRTVGKWTSCERSGNSSANGGENVANAPPTGQPRRSSISALGTYDGKNTDSRNISGDGSTVTGPSRSSSTTSARNNPPIHPAGSSSPATVTYRRPHTRPPPPPSPFGAAVFQGLSRLTLGRLHTPPQYVETPNIDIGVGITRPIRRQGIMPNLGGPVRAVLRANISGKGGPIPTASPLVLPRSTIPGLSSASTHQQHFRSNNQDVVQGGEEDVREGDNEEVNDVHPRGMKREETSSDKNEGTPTKKVCTPSPRAHKDSIF